MASRKIPLSLNTICVSLVLTLWLLSSEMTQAADAKFKACAPRSCGGIGPSISYPFWVANEHESYCGYPTFQVSCDDGHAVLAISNDNYIIRNISYDKNSLILSNAALYEEDSCHVPHNNFSTQRTLFNYSENHVDLYLFYDCPSKPDPYLTYPIKCATNSSHYSFGVFKRDDLEATGYALNSCETTVNAPVDMTGSYSLVNSANRSYSDILKTGFALEWTANNCSACTKSGGRCGFDNNEFVCFCRNGPHHKICRKGTHKDELLLPIFFKVVFSRAGNLF